MTKDQYNELLDKCEETIQKEIIKANMMLGLWKGLLEAVTYARENHSPDEDEEEDISDILAELEDLKKQIEKR